MAQAKIIPIRRLLWWSCGATLLISALLMFGCWCLAVYIQPYEIKDLVQVESPDQRYIASGYHVLSGATAADTTVVVIHGKEKKVNDPENKPVFVAEDTLPLHLAWIDKQRLSVRCLQKRLVLKETSWKDVNIEYGEP